MIIAFELREDKGLREDKLFQPFKLVSLWDMFIFDVWRFLSVSRLSGMLTGGDQVKKFYNPLIEKIVAGLGVELKPFEAATIPADSEEVFSSFRDELMEMGLTVSAESAKAIIERIKRGGDKTKWDDLVPLSDELMRILEYELKSKLVLMVPAEKTGYYNRSLKVFSTLVRDNFPSADQDMTEACKCFALGRYTASVFHSMRVMEAGLVALGGALGLSVSENWNTALDQIEKEIRSRNRATHGDAWRVDEPFYTEAATHFRMVKNAWRNYVVHLHEHYDEERARGILNSVSDFMRHLATKLREEEETIDESPNPE